MSGTLQIEARSGDLSALQADIGILYKYKDESAIAGGADPAISGRLAELVQEDRFVGRAGKSMLWHSPRDQNSSCRRYLVMGLGPREDLALDAYRRYLGNALVEADRLGATTVALPLLEARAQTQEAADAARALAEGVLLGTYRFDRYKSEPRPGRQHLRRILVAAGKASLDEVRSGLTLGERTAEATNFARDLVNEPAGSLTPPRMSEIARDVARDGKLEIKVIGPEEMRRLGMGGILGVSQGSKHPPQFIHMTYHPVRSSARKVALLGKGLTFDSGGLSLKSADGMETMKCDMSGAAAVLATLRALPAISPPVEVVGLLGMAENMPGGGAIRPGDVLRIMNGKTVEVRNTDAEGRLVLADGLSYASKLEGVDVTLDLATLTGACVVALGPIAAGVMGNDRTLVDAVLRAAAEAGEKMWPLPMYSEYREHIRSDVADIKNTGIRWGGAITAALFLREFVRPGLRWAHLDIAGPAFGEKDYSYLKKGGTGHGVRTLIRYLTNLQP